jgi:hypothetical protein
MAIASGVKPTASTQVGEDYNDAIDSVASGLPGDIFKPNGGLKSGITWKAFPCSQ